MKRVLFLLALLLLCCLEEPARPPAFAAPNFGAAAGDDWQFEVTAGAGARELAIVAAFPPVSELEMSVNTGAEDYLRDVEIETPQGWRALLEKDTSWFLPASCHTHSCRVRYRYLLAEAARALEDIDLARTHHGDTFLAPASTWLLRPLAGVRGRQVIFHVQTPPGLGFVTGIFPAPGRPRDTYALPAVQLPDSPYAAFGAFRQKTINLPGGIVEAAIAPGEIELGDAAVFNWITTAAQALTAYYGKFPIKRVMVLVRPMEGRGIGYGSTLGNGGAAIAISVGRNTRQRALDTDWIMTHELVHCAYPSLERERHAWAEEGLATYVEPWARVRVGAANLSQAWHDVVRDMPQGLPEEGDRGLDNTPTWERIYWGGALFYLVADVEIRERTKNRYGLEDALRGIAAAGGTVDASWDIHRTLAEGDRAVGVPVLTELYDRMRAKPVMVDLPALWQKLGIERRGDSIAFDDRAPEAAIRRLIVNGKL